MILDDFIKWQDYMEQHTGSVGCEGKAMQA